MLLLNCTSDDGKAITNVEILGEWRLIEQLSDPGDGSGTFMPTDSNKTLEFFSDGTITSNGTLCYMNGQSTNASNGTYELISDAAVDAQYEGFIFSENCDFPETKIGFNITAEGHLILWYFCIEPCAEKFIKLN